MFTARYGLTTYLRIEEPKIELRQASCAYGRENRHIQRNLWERDNLGYPDIDGRIILRWIFRKWDVRLWTGSSWLRIGIGGGHL